MKLLILILPWTILPSNGNAAIKLQKTADSSGILILSSIIPPSPTNSNKKKLYDIKTVDIALAVRSKNPFYNDNKKKTIFALTDSSRDLTRFNDRFLRETLTVTAYARNVGLE